MILSVICSVLGDDSSEILMLVDVLFTHTISAALQFAQYSWNTCCKAVNIIPESLFCAKMSKVLYP